MIGFHYQVILSIASHGNARSRKAVIAARFGSFYTQHILQPDGIKNGFDVVISISSLFDHIQTDIYFCIGINYHDFEIYGF